MEIYVTYRFAKLKTLPLLYWNPFFLVQINNSFLSFLFFSFLKVKKSILSSNIRKYHHFDQNFVAKTVHFTVFVFLAPIWEKRYNLRDRKLSIAA